MDEMLTAKIQEEFAECYTLDEVARLYCEIRVECEKQLNHMNFQIAKEMKDNGVLDKEWGAE